MTRLRKSLLPAALAVGLVLAGCGESSSGSGSDTETWRLAHCCAPDSHFDYGAKRFAELVSEYSDGAIEVEVFPDGQLGQETEAIQSVQRGTIELTFIGHDPLAQFASVTTLLSMPYLFEDHQHAFELLDGELGDAITSDLSEVSLHVLGWGHNGARVYTNNARPIEAPGDLAGLKIRSPENPVNLAVTEALGGVGVPMPYGEVYSALQQGTIDGQENAVLNIAPANLQEVQDYMSMTHHLLSFTVLIISEELYAGLDGDLRQAVEQAAADAMRDQRAYAEQITDQLISEMEAAGVQVNWPDLAPFRAATRPIHDQYIGEAFDEQLYRLAQAEQ
ncbi:MAG TPA: TRAP transporter substrate-binding protein [Natronosporangium sp.]